MFWDLSEHSTLQTFYIYHLSFFIMRVTRLPILLLSLKEPIITSAHLAERQPQELWDPGKAIGATFTFLGGAAIGIGNAIGNLFQDPQDSDASKTIPPPDTVTEPDEQTPPGSPNAAPTSPPSSATSSPAEPVYKINLNDDQPDTVPNLPGVLPSVNQECDVSLHIFSPSYPFKA